MNLFTKHVVDNGFYLSLDNQGPTIASTSWSMAPAAAQSREGPGGYPGDCGDFVMFLRWRGGFLLVGYGGIMVYVSYFL